MSEILLVNPKYEYKKIQIWRHDRVWPPLDLAIAASILRKDGHHVEILDINALPETVINNERIKKFDKIFVTSASLDRWQCPHLDIDSFLSTVRELKKINSGAKIYVFGSHPTMRPKEVLEMTGADAAIISEPELTIQNLCKDDGNLSKIEGIAYLNNNQLKITKPGDLADLSKFPVPAFDLLPMEKYYYEIMGDRFTLLETTRGCPFLCTFCSEDQMYGIRYRMKSLELIEKELDVCIKEFGVKNIYFIDLEFTLSKGFVNDICDMMIRNNYRIAWACQTRADTVDFVLLKKMKMAGCRVIHFGLESGSPRILESTGKKITLDNIRKGIKLAKKVGMEVVCFSMMGLPNETKEDMEMTIKFAKEVDPDYISFHVATPYPGTKFYEAVKNEIKGVFPTSYEGVYSQNFIKHMTRKAFMEFYMRSSYIFKKIKQSPKLLMRQIKLFMKYIK